MVATVLRLRYRVLGNTLSRHPWQLVGFILGCIWALSALVGVIAALVAVGGTGDIVLATTVVVLAGSALILGWVVVPLLTAGMDATVDLAHLVPLPLSRRQIMLSLAATGLAGIPGIVTTLAALGTVVVWWRSPPAAIAAVPCALAGVVTAVLAGRLMNVLSSGLGGHRRGRELVGTLVLALLILAGPILTAVMAVLGSGDDVAARLGQAAGILAWTPVGAAWAVPAALAAGTWGSALLMSLIAVASIGVLWAVWARALDRAAARPARQVAHQRAPGSLGLFGLLPTGPVGATWARSLTGWLRDPRYLRQLIFAPLFPIVLLVAGGTGGPLFAAAAVFVAFFLAITTYSDISYDGRAFASVLATGIRGRQDRLGRVLGAASVGVPAVVVVAVVVAAISGTWSAVPAALGVSLGILLAGYAVGAVSSALLVTPVAAPGDSPFKTVPGQTFLSGILVFVVIAAVVVLSVPVGALGLAYLLSGDALWGWLAVTAGIVVGLGEVAGGILLGGRTLDRTAPTLLARIAAFPTS